MKILEQIRKELRVNVDLEYKKNSQGFFKERIKLYGVRGPINGKIGRKYWLAVKELNKKERFLLIEELLKSGYNEEAAIAFGWLRRLLEKLEKNDFLQLEKWLEKYIDNWAKCDDFCVHIAGPFLLKFPQFLPKTKRWAKSGNRWQKRAAAVSLIYPVRQGKYLANIFEIAELLLRDKDDLVQKGYGWALKEAADIFRNDVFDFVIKNKKKIPRTALRYAIEKMPDNLRKKAMAG